MERGKIKKADTVDDEVDLMDVFQKIGRGIIGFVRVIADGLLVVIVFLLRKWLYLSISIILALGVSYLIRNLADKVYSSIMNIRSNVVQNADMIEHVNKLHQMASTRNFSALTEALNIPEEKAKEIKSIEAFWVIDQGADFSPDYIDFKNEHNVYDTINVRMQDRFALKVRTTNPENFRLIREGIVKFIEKNELFQSQNQMRLQQTEVLLARLEYDIQQLDSLQKVKYFEESRRLLPREGGQMIFLQEHKTQLLYDDIYNLYARKQQMELQKTIYADLITVLSDFTIPSRSDNNTLFYASWIVPILFGLSIVFLILFDHRRRISEILNDD